MSSERNGMPAEGPVDEAAPGGCATSSWIKASPRPRWPRPSRTTSCTAPKVGDPVLAIGSPLGLAGSASSGIVSDVRPGPLQFSAPVSPGNSGGPVVDRRGHVLGVATAKLVGNGAEGLSFAVPVDAVCAALEVC